MPLAKCPGVKKAVTSECFSPWPRAGMISIRCIKQLKVFVGEAAEVTPNV